MHGRYVALELHACGRSYDAVLPRDWERRRELAKHKTVALLCLPLCARPVSVLHNTILFDTIYYTSLDHTVLLFYYTILYLTILG